MEDFIMNDKNTQSKVNVLFSSSKLLIEFLKDPYFEIINAYFNCCNFMLFTPLYPIC